MPQSAELTQCDEDGLKVSLYLNLGNDCTTPVWSYHKGVTGDLNIGHTNDQNERSVRDPAQNFKQYVPGKGDIEITGQQVVDFDYEGNAFINSATKGGEAIDVLVLSGYLSDIGSAGYRGKFFNFDQSFTGPESGAGEQSFLLKPAACVATACKVRPVKVSVADTIADYDPGTFTPTV